MQGKGSLRVLVLADIVARIGREAVKKLLPELIKKEKADLVIGNAENLAHGKGVNKKSLEEMKASGITILTSGNHIWGNPEGIELLGDEKNALLRPENYPKNNPGKGQLVVTVGVHEILVINLMGRVFMREALGDPFAALDEILLQYDTRSLSAILVDFHAEATSEKVAFGWYADGKVSAVWGSHTHVPTADARILEQGTGYITDVGMTGARNSIIGVAKKSVMRGFLTQMPQRFEYDKTGEAVLNAVIFDIDTRTRVTTNVSPIQKTVTIG
jgi:hypothetical protein